MAWFEDKERHSKARRHGKAGPTYRGSAGSLNKIKLGKVRTKKPIIYHGRIGRPVIHETKSPSGMYRVFGTGIECDSKGRRYIMVRKKGGGVKRLYEGSKYKVNGKIKRLKLVGDPGPTLRRFKKSIHVASDTGEVFRMFEPTVIRKGSVLIRDSQYKKHRKSGPDRGFAVPLIKSKRKKKNPCPGSKIRSKGKGRGKGRGGSLGPRGIPVGRKRRETRLDKEIKQIERRIEREKKSIYKSFDDFQKDLDKARMISKNKIMKPRGYVWRIFNADTGKTIRRVKETKKLKSIIHKLDKKHPTVRKEFELVKEIKKLKL